MSALFFFVLKPNTPELTEEDIRTLLEQRYPGTVESLTWNEDAAIYLAIIETETNQYHLEIDSDTGHILAFIRKEMPAKEEDEWLTAEEVRAAVLEYYSEKDIHVKELNLQTEANPPSFLAHVQLNGEDGTLKIDATSGAVLSSSFETEDKPAQPISEQRAKEIALEQVEGTVDDIDLEEDDHGRLVYEVEIEDTPYDDDVMIIIDALTEEIVQIIWD